MRLLLTLLFTALFTVPTTAQAECEADGLPLPYAALIEAERAFKAGRPGDVVATLLVSDALPEGPAARRRDLLRGRAHYLAGEHPAAQEALVAVLKGRRGEPAYRPSACDVDPGEARWTLAQIQGDAGNQDAQRRVWEQIWTHNPTSSRSADAETALSAYGSLGPETPAGRTLLERRAASLTALHQHADALSIIDQIPLDGTIEVVRDRAAALMRARKYQRAADLLGTLPAPEPADLFQRALSTSRLGKYEAAAALYQELLDRHPQASQAQEASFKLGYLAWDGGKPELALTRFDAHRRRFPRSRHDDEALWFSGWTLMRLGRIDEATALMRELSKKSSSLAAGGLYWDARMTRERSGATAATQAMEEVLVKHPDTIYAWWAARDLGQTWEPRPEPAMPDPTTLTTTLDAAQGQALSAGLALAAAGLDDWAAAELAPLMSAVRSNREKALTLGQALTEAGAWHEARKLAMPWCKDEGESADEVALRLCWPRPGGKAVQEAAARAGLPPLLPFAIMRAESAFNPHVVSHAGARGLMQLMPKLVDVPADDLFDPIVNTQEGVKELASLRASMHELGIDPLEPLIIAAYNGGEAAVRRWLSDQPTPLDVDRWAEEISFGETRRYVRRVLGTLAVYMRVYGG